MKSCANCSRLQISLRITERNFFKLLDAMERALGPREFARLRDGFNFVPESAKALKRRGFKRINDPRKKDVQHKQR